MVCVLIYLHVQAVGAEARSSGHFKVIKAIRIQLPAVVLHMTCLTDRDHHKTKWCEVNLYLNEPMLIEPILSLVACTSIIDSDLLL